jgi:ADP-ribose pyrophosphatase YjhB (NUDIX family)
MSETHHKQKWTPFSSKSFADVSFDLPMHKPDSITTADVSQEIAYSPNYSFSTGSDLWGSSFEDSPPLLVGTPVLPMNEIAELQDFSEAFNFMLPTRKADFRQAKQPSQSQSFSSQPQPQFQLQSQSQSQLHSAQSQLHSQFALQARGSPMKNSVSPSIFSTSVNFSASRATILFFGAQGTVEEDLILRLKIYFSVHVAAKLGEARSYLNSTRIDALVCTHDPELPSGLELAKLVRVTDPHVFVSFFGHFATTDPLAQTLCMDAGANMVVDDPADLLNTFIRALKVIGRDPFTVDNTFSCPVCEFEGLMEDELCDHVVLYHGGQPNCLEVTCPICGLSCKSAKVPFPVHMHKSHGPVGRTRQILPRKQHHTYIFVLVVCQRPSDGKFLMVNEPASWGWWLPGGRVEWGEGLRAAALRETRDEAGIEIELQGILKLEYASGPSRTRQRIIFFAHPLDECAKPKAVPDYASRGACWVSLEEVKKLPLRGEEPKMWFNYIVSGGEIHSINMLSQNRDEE